MRWSQSTVVALAAIVLTACAPGGVKTSSGRVLKFVEHYSPAEMEGGKYVVIELNGLTKERSIASVSSEKPKSIKPNQEVIVFDKGLTKYAIALDTFNGVRLHHNTIPGTIMAGTSEPYFECSGGKPSKTDAYTACSSDFYRTFLPYEVTVSHAKGQMPQSVYDNWKKRTANWVAAWDPKPIIERLQVVPVLEGAVVVSGANRN